MLHLSPLLTTVRNSELSRLNSQLLKLSAKRTVRKLRLVELRCPHSRATLCSCTGCCGLELASR